MKKTLMLVAVALSFAASAARAQTDLSAYTDANGFLDVQKLTCAQLAGTWQGDADMLMTWYSGWYNGLAKKHFLHVSRGKELEHQVIFVLQSKLEYSNYRCDCRDIEGRKNKEWHQDEIAAAPGTPIGAGGIYCDQRRLPLRNITGEAGAILLNCSTLIGRNLL